MVKDHQTNVVQEKEGRYFVVNWLSYKIAAFFLKNNCPFLTSCRLKMPNFHMIDGQWDISKVIT